MIRCTTVGIEPSLLCYEMCVLAYRCGALKAWEREKVRMTREEAIGKINAIKKYLTAGNPIWDVREIDEALNMAIKALEQEPIVRCKDCISKPNNTCEVDLISKADAIEVLCKSCRHDDKEHYYPNCELQMYCDDINALKALSSAEAVQGCDGSRYDTRPPQKECLYCKRYWRDSYERKGGDAE